MRSILYFILLTILAAPVSAAPITYQGQLQQSGQLVDGAEVTLSFQLFATASGVDSLGAAIQKVVFPQNGLFQVELDFGAGAFDGSPRFLEILVDGTLLGERQAIVATPQALIATTTVAGAIGTSQINATQVQRRVTGNCLAGQYIQAVNEDGTVDCGSEPPGWRLGGNVGTDSAANFLGTTDNQALELRTANVRSLRIEPSAELFNGSPITANVIAGSHANEVTPGVRGATIGGGGVPAGDGDPLHNFGAPNRVTDHYGTVGGGFANQAGDGEGTPSDGVFATVGGGEYNIASGLASTVGGGASNTASGTASTIGGGLRNCAGASYSWAGGNRAKVRPAVDPVTGSCSGLTYPGDDGDAGSFVWADSTNADFISQRANQFRVRANGGVEFQTGSLGLAAVSNSASTANPTLVLNNGGTGRLLLAFTGNTGIPGGTEDRMRLENNGDLWISGALITNSDRAQKEDVQAVDAQIVLDRLSELQINSWRYLSGNEGVRHIGPMAQDFHAAFGFGISETTISAVDAQGIAFAAIQALNQRLKESQAEVAVLKVQAGQMRELADRNADLEARLASLEALLLDDRQVAERLQ